VHRRRTNLGSEDVETSSIRYRRANTDRRLDQFGSSLVAHPQIQDQESDGSGWRCAEGMILVQAFCTWAKMSQKSGDLKA
jgi:hypothetical protein